MVPIGVLCWLGLAAMIILGFLCIFFFRGSTTSDVVSDIIAVGFLLVTGAIFASVFVPKSWTDPIHDAMLFGFGFNSAPNNPVYIPNAAGTSEIDLPPIAPTDEWRLQFALKSGEDGKINLPQDTKVQAMKAWTVDREGTESLAVTVK